MGPLTKKRKNAISPKLGDFVRGEAPSGTSEQQQQQQRQQQQQQQQQQQRNNPQWTQQKEAKN